MTGQELAKEFSKFVNCMANDKNEDEFIKSVMREHRTLQQSMFGLMCKLMRKWAEEGNYDLRNEYTIETCKKIVESVEEVRYRAPCI